MNYRLQWSVATDKGTTRKVNEDSVLVHPAEEDLAHGNIALPPAGQICIVADGMGGHRGGQEASNTAVRKITQYYYNQQDMAPLDALRAALRQANREITLLGQSHPELERMGTTVVLIAAQDNHAYMANVGDSRAYLWRQGEITQLSQDDSWVAHQVQMQTITPDQARNHAQRNVLMQHLGTTHDIEPHLLDVQVQPGDRLLLCTDGVTGVVTDEELACILAHNPAHMIPTQLVQLALKKGSDDNVTAAVGEYRSVGPTSITRRFLRRQRHRSGGRKIAIGLLLTLVGLVLLTLGHIVWGAVSETFLRETTGSEPSSVMLVPPTTAATSIPTDAAKELTPPEPEAAIWPAANLPDGTAAPPTIHRGSVALPRIDIWQPEDDVPGVLNDAVVRSIYNNCVPDSNGVSYILARDAAADETLSVGLGIKREVLERAEINPGDQVRENCAIYNPLYFVQIENISRNYAFQPGGVYLLHYTSTPVTVFADEAELAERPASAEERTAVSRCEKSGNSADALVIVSAPATDDTQPITAMLDGKEHYFGTLPEEDGVACQRVDPRVEWVAVGQQQINVQLEPGAFTLVRFAPPASGFYVVPAPQQTTRGIS
jgi:serine/threonine protein phosphatase PrpC